MAGIHTHFDRRRSLDVDTNFFEAGFTSALLAEVVTDLNAAGFTASLVDLYRYPTVRELAVALGLEQRRTPVVPPWRRGPAIAPPRAGSAAPGEAG
jgi:hypothetical protein